jgi:hypothetical protein
MTDTLSKLLRERALSTPDGPARLSVDVPIVTLS